MLFTVCIVKDEQGSKIYLSLFPSVDRFFWQLRGNEVRIADRDLFIGQALERIGEAGKSAYGEMGLGSAISQVTLLGHEFPHKWNRLDKFSTLLFSILGGRALLWDEVVTCIRMRLGSTIATEKIGAALQWLFLHNKVEIYPAVAASGAAATWHCKRCGGKRNHLFVASCARCNKRCVSCDNCISLGRSRSCTPLFLFSAPEKIGRYTVSLDLPPLTTGQKKVADACIQWFREKEKELLVWAVTGSGKTEILLPVVQYVLERGGSVLWATPRRDVVQELSPRLSKAFPGLDIVSLHKGSRQVWSTGRLVVATAHQAWRFYRRFQLVVVDEVDAFPLQGDFTLMQGLDRAGILPGKRILLTATPPKRWQKGRLSSVVLPARYHGYPLPEPKVIRISRLWRRIDRGDQLQQLTPLFQRIHETEGQGLLFVPRVQDVDRLLRWLKVRYPKAYRESAGVSARDSDRGEVITSFRQGKIRFLVTTTILERGVTVPRCHVAVIGADHPVFDMASLIQIAGRVGRSASYQVGEVWFVSAEATEGQRQAVRTLRNTNDFARKKGLLRE